MNTIQLLKYHKNIGTYEFHFKKIIPQGAGRYEDQESHEKYGCYTQHVLDLGES